MKLSPDVLGNKKNHELPQYGLWVLLTEYSAGTDPSTRHRPHLHWYPFLAIFTTLLCSGILSNAKNNANAKTGQLCSSQWPMPILFLVSKKEESDYDNNPIQIVRDDGTIGCRILPAKEGIKDTPSTTAAYFWIATLRKLLAYVQDFGQLSIHLHAIHFGVCHTILSQIRPQLHRHQRIRSTVL